MLRTHDEETIMRFCFGEFPDLRFNREYSILTGKRKVKKGVFC